MSRTNLHVNLNDFYASVECLYRPEIRDKLVIVYDDIEARHGISQKLSCKGFRSQNR